MCEAKLVGFQSGACCLWLSSLGEILSVASNTAPGVARCTISPDPWLQAAQWRKSCALFCWRLYIIT